MKLNTGLLASIALITLSQEKLQYGFGQVSIIALQLGIADLADDTEQGFDDFDKKITDFYSGATTTDVVALAELLDDGIKAHSVDQMHLVSATRFKKTMSGMYEHIAQHDAGNDFTAKLASIADVMELLDERIRVLTPPPADIEVDKDKADASAAPHAAGERVAEEQIQA